MAKREPNRIETDDRLTWEELRARAQAAFDGKSDEEIMEDVAELIAEVRAERQESREHPEC